MGFGLTKKRGHQCSLVSEVLGACCLAASLYLMIHSRTIVGGSKPLRGRAVLGSRRLLSILVPSGIALIGIGLWLRRRLYLTDPEARSAYRQEMLSLSFAACIRRFRSVAIIVDVLGVDEARKHLNELFADVDGLSGASLLDVLTRLGGGPQVVLQCRAANLFTQADIQMLFFRCVKIQSCASRSAPFTELWQKFCEASAGKGIDEVIASLDIRNFQLPLRDLLEQEFLTASSSSSGDEVRQTTAEPMRATAPPSVSDDPAQPTWFVDDMTVYDRIEKLAPFCVQAGIVTRDFFAVAIRESRMSRTLPYSKLLERGLFRLYRSGLIDAAWCQRQLEEEWRRYGTPLRVLTSTVSLSDQLDSGMIPQATAFREPFSAALPTSPFTDVRGGTTGSSNGIVACRLTPETSIIDFLEVYQAILQRHGEQLLDPRWWPAVLRARHEWDVAQEAARSQFRLTAKEPIKTKDMTADAFAKEKKKYQAEVNELERQRRTFLEQEKQRIHGNFCCMRATGAPSHALPVSSSLQASSITYAAVANLSNNQCLMM